MYNLIGDDMKIIKKYHKNFLAFFIPILIYSIFFLSKGVLTKYNFATSDSLAQFVPTYQYLHDVLHKETTFPYTQSKGLGGTMYGVIFYGVSNPINLLVYFFEDVQLFMFISTIIKLGLCGLTMFILLKNKVKDSYTNIFFSLAYPLSTYVLLYYTNIMWLDSLWLAPLLILSIDKMIHKEKDLYYILILFFALISNYYTGYILVVFSVIYFFYELFISNKQSNFITIIKNNRKIIFNFFITTFLTGLLISFILIPVFVESLNYVRVYDNEFKLINFQYLDLISGTYIGFGSILNPINYYGFPIYCGTIIIPLVIYYFTNKDIKKKNKIATLIVLLTFFLPIIIIPLNNIWHMFTNPIGFNYRYSFLTIIFMLLIAAQSFNNLNGSKKFLLIYTIIYLILTASMAYSNYHSPDYYLLYLNLNKIIISIAFLLISNHLVVKKKKNLIILFLIFDLTINLAYFYKTAIFVPFSESKQIEENMRTAKEIYNDSYRIETVLPLSFNDSLIYKYRGVTSFFSSSNIYSLRSHYILRGKSNLNNHHTYLQHDIISDTILGIKYILDDNIDENYKYISTMELNDKKYYLQKNEKALPIGYVVSNKIKNLDNDKYLEFGYLNNLLNSMSNEETNYFKKLTVKRIDDKFIIEKSKNDSQIFIINDELPRKAEIRKYSQSKKYITYYNSDNQSLILRFKNKKNNLDAYVLDYEKFNKLINSIEKVDVIENKNNYIKCNIDAKDNNVLLFTIPYELGWKILVDNKQVSYYKVINSFVGIDITQGKHTIELKYEQPYLKLGIIMSLISLTTLITYKLRIKEKD